MEVIFIKFKKSEEDKYGYEPNLVSVEIGALTKWNVFVTLNRNNMYCLEDMIVKEGVCYIEPDKIPDYMGVEYLNNKISGQRVIACVGEKEFAEKARVLNSKEVQEQIYRADSKVLYQKHLEKERKKIALENAKILEEKYIADIKRMQQEAIENWPREKEKKITPLTICLLPNDTDKEALVENRIKLEFVPGKHSYAIEALYLHNTIIALREDIGAFYKLISSFVRDCQNALKSNNIDKVVHRKRDGEFLNKDEIFSHNNYPDTAGYEASIRVKNGVERLRIEAHDGRVRHLGLRDCLIISDELNRHLNKSRHAATIGQ